MAEAKRSKHKGAKGNAADTPALEWIAAGLGLLLTLAMLGTIGWEMIAGGGDRPPAIEARIERIVPTGGGYVVEIALRNESPATAAAVQVQGELTKPDGEVATSGATLDYVPGESTRHAGLFFKEDPRLGRLEVRTLGYAQP
jgi:uncharacterized protein (TIGR02588 family)